MNICAGQYYNICAGQYYIRKHPANFTGMKQASLIIEITRVDKVGFISKNIFYRYINEPAKEHHMIYKYFMRGEEMGFVKHFEFITYEEKEKIINECMIKEIIE
jgi:hypothetical protein